jgi:hypothetical protein
VGQRRASKAAAVINSNVVRHLLRTEMSKIKGQLDKSDYEIYDDFINFRIDDYWLDEKIDELYPGQSYKGLILSRPKIGLHELTCKHHEKID